MRTGAEGGKKKSNNFVDVIDGSSIVWIKRHRQSPQSSPKLAIRNSGAPSSGFATNLSSIINLYWLDAQVRGEQEGTLKLQYLRDLWSRSLPFSPYFGQMWMDCRC